MSTPEQLRDRLADLVDDAPADPDRLVSVHRRATRIRRRRVGAVAAVTAVVVAAAAAIATGRTGSTRTEFIEPISTTLPKGILVVDHDGNMFVLDDLRTRQLPPVTGVRLQPAPLVLPLAGGRSLVTAGGALVVLDPRQPRNPHVLVRFDGSDVEVPGVGRRVPEWFEVARGGEVVWLLTYPAGTGELESPAGKAVPLRLDGTLAGQPVDVPAHGRVVTADDAGVYVEVPDRVPRPRRHSLVRIQPDGDRVALDELAGTGQHSGGYGLLDGDTAPGCAMGPCPREVVDLAGGRVIVTDRPARYDVPTLEAYSVDGRYVAGRLVGLDPSRGQGRGWGIVDVAMAHVSRVPGSIRRLPWENQADDSGYWSEGRFVWAGPTSDGRHYRIGAYIPATGAYATTTVPATWLRVVGVAG